MAGMPAGSSCHSQALSPALQKLLFAARRQCRLASLWTALPRSRCSDLHGGAGIAVASTLPRSRPLPGFRERVRARLKWEGGNGVRCDKPCLGELEGDSETGGGSRRGRAALQRKARRELSRARTRSGIEGRSGKRQGNAGAWPPPVLPTPPNRPSDIKRCGPRHPSLTRTWPHSGLPNRAGRVPARA